ncbi:MAG: hypothetical protein ACR2IK_20475 [Chloroflexota bacterium]
MTTPPPAPGPGPVSARRQEVATSTFARTLANLEGKVSPDHPREAWLHAHPVVQGDDEFGAAEGYLVQGDAVPWLAIEGLRAMAAYGVAAHIQVAHNNQGASADCALCRDAQGPHPDRSIDSTSVDRGAEARSRAMADVTSFLRHDASNRDIRD